MPDPRASRWVPSCSGHTLINKVLATTSATVVSLAILLEMPGATIIAAVTLQQLPPLGIIPAVALMFAGIVLVIRAGSRTVPSEIAAGLSAFGTGPPHASLDSAA